MSELTLIAVFAATVFLPSFIGIRARTNANWRSLKGLSIACMFWTTAVRASVSA